MKCQMLRSSISVAVDIKFKKKSNFIQWKCSNPTYFLSKLNV